MVAIENRKHLYKAVLTIACIVILSLVMFSQIARQIDMFRIDEPTLSLFSSSDSARDGRSILLSDGEAETLAGMLKAYRFRMFDELKVEMKDYYVFRINDRTAFLIDADFDKYNADGTRTNRTYMITTYTYARDQQRSDGAYISVDVLSAAEELYTRRSAAE